MAFPSQNVVLLKEAFEFVRQAASTIKSGASDLKALAQGTSTGASSIVKFALLLAEQRDILETYASTPGLGAYAQEQVNDENLNIVTEYQTMVGAIDDTVEWIVENFPADTNDYLLERKFQSDGRTTERTFTSAQLSGLSTQLDALIATID